MKKYYLLFLLSFFFVPLVSSEFEQGTLYYTASQKDNNITLNFSSCVSQLEPTIKNLVLTGSQSSSWENDTEEAFYFKGVYDSGLSNYTCAQADCNNSVDENFNTYMTCGTSSSCNLTENFTVLNYTTDLLMWTGKTGRISGSPILLLFYNYSSNLWVNITQFPSSLYDEGTFKTIQYNITGNLSNYLVSGKPLRTMVSMLTGSTGTEYYAESKIAFSNQSRSYPSNITMSLNGTWVYNISGEFNNENITFGYGDVLLRTLSCNSRNCSNRLSIHSDSVGSVSYINRFEGICVSGGFSTPSSPSLSEVIETVTGGGSLGQVLKSWNPSVYDEISIKSKETFSSGNFTNLFNNSFQLAVLFVKYIFRSPASLVPEGGIK